MRSLVRSRSRDGVALVLVLAFILLTSILILSFIAFSSSNHSSTASYAKAIQAQEIAQGGLQDILNDLHQEIVAGSSNYVSGSTTVYVPTANYTITPRREGYDFTAWGTDVNAPLDDNLSPTLVRVSRTSQTSNKTDLYPPMTNSYYTGGAVPLNRASAANTATPSLNGRTVTFARWNKSLLLAPSTVVGDPALNSFVIPGSFATNYTSTTGTLRLSAGGGDSYSTNPPPYGAPDWVYVTRSGSRAVTTSDLTSTTASILPSNNLESTNAVIGRYAYIVYDEGAMLDANIVGFPSSATNASSAYTDTTSGITQVIQGKSYPAYADLSVAQLMGSAPNSQTLIDNFVKWRNAGGLTGAGNNYLGTVATYATNGFLGFTNSDNPLVSRQDLINYMINIDPPSSDGSTGYNTPSPYATRALPYLGTFSRSLSEPTWAPTANAPGGSSNTIYNYVSNAENATSSPFSTASPNPNVDLATLRWPGSSSLSVSHYNDDTSTSSYSVTGGSPFLQTRFSLDKIKWLANDPYNSLAPVTTTAYVNAVQACFGLKWGPPGLTGAGSSTTANGGNPCWNYVGPSGSTPVSSIETLTQVAAESVPREPNFFEVLKAVILSGSLGKSPGQAASVNGTGLADFHNATSPFGPGGLFCYSYDGHGASATPTVFAPAALPDYQIIQIGANIINQFDTDFYPVPIYFKFPNVGIYDPVSGSKGNPIYGPVDMIYGDANLPYLNRVHMLYTTTAPGGNTNPTDNTDAYNASNGGTKSLSCWYQPELWNPHAQPAAAPTSIPHNFQVRAYGSVFMGWNWGSTQGGAASGSAQSQDWYLTNSNSETSSFGKISFTDSSTTSSFYPHPFILTSDSIPAFGAATVSFPNGSNASLNLASTISPPPPYYSANSNLNHFVAFYGGSTPTSGTTTPYVPYWTMTTGVSQNAYSQPVNSIGSIAEPIYANTYTLGWVDTNNGFHPYSYITGAFPYAYDVMYSPGGNGDTRNGSVNPDSLATIKFGAVDIRTQRFSIYIGYFSGDLSPPTSTTLFSQNSTTKRYLTTVAMPNGAGFTPVNTRNISGEDWAVNTTTGSTTAGLGLKDVANNFDTPVYYSDPDGTVRPGDGVYGSYTTGDGEPLFTSAGTGGTALGDKSSGTGSDDVPASTTNNSGNARHGRRSVILNRPFRNVGELGYVFRDLPFKTLDFFSPTSADAGLLDVFSIKDETRIVNGQVDSMVAGRVNPNNSPYPVLSAIFSYASKKDLDVTYNMSANDVKNVGKAAASLLNKSTGANPILNRAGLVTTLMNKSAGGMANALANAVDKNNKSYFEAPVRALADNVETRSWTLLIDVIAQSGHFAPNATTLDNFIVEGEKRYWLHVSIDRYTGKIIDQQLEPVYE